ncbi:hypothetical protein [Streptomyces rubiginosohelvolus]|uniref:hypothetical protein n=1 Tax=Streptomyces rubiginosohelvolus TaxID=67362 RepID=UPI0016795CED|nr:hypothetical protein [Streptomyces pluricolorescens]
MKPSEDPISQLREARSRATRLNAEYRDSVATVLEQAAKAVRDGGDVDQVLHEVRLLLPPAAAATAVEEAPSGEPEADERPETEVIKERVRTWYLDLPQEVRTSWSDRQIVDDPDYRAALENLTGRKWDTVRTRYLAPLRKELGEGPQPRRG